MALDRIKLKSFLLSTLLLTSFCISASEHKTLGTKVDYYIPKKIELVQSSKSINITTKNGELSLPYYKKKEIYQPLAVSISNKLHLREDISVDLLKTKLEERKELEVLSEKLGIKDLDANYLDFYREVADWLGTRYRMGSMSSKAVDCSGFTKIIYNKIFEIDLPRTSRDMSNTLRESLGLDELLPGDLVFFATRGKKYINHVGMYIGEGHFVHASIKGVKVSDLTDGYYKKTWRKAGRV